MTASGRRRLVAIAGLVGIAVVGAAALALDRRARSGPATERAPVTSESIVLLGDSITELGAWDDLLSDRPVVNAGYVGHTSAQLVPVAAEVAEQRPRAVFVLAGTNDIRDGLPASSTRAELARILDALAAEPGTTVVLQTLLPRADAVEAVAAANAEIVALAAERDVRLLDLHAPFDDGAGGLRDTDTDDGIHLTDAGYARWAALLSAEIDRLPDPG